MDVLTFNLEVTALSAVLVGVFALRRWLGRTPLYLCLGILLLFLSVGSRLKLTAPVLGGAEAPYTSLMHLALILTGIVLVYALEGTQRTQQLIGGIVVALVVLLLLRLLLAWHLDDPAVDTSLYGRERWLAPDPVANIIAIVALAVAGLVIIIVYQFMMNLAGWMPVVLAFVVALVAGIMADGLVYGGLSGRFDGGAFADQLLGKLFAGAAAALPAAAYISWHYRRYGAAQTGKRRTLEILDLKRELAAVKAMMVTARAQYAHVKQVFSRYVAPDVVDELLSDVGQLKLGGELRTVTILFSDIRGYSTLSERMTPEETMQVLNQYFDWMMEVLNEHRATVIEIEGDAILAVFNAPLEQPDHAARGVLTAIDMLDVVKALNVRWEGNGMARHWHDAGLEDFRIRIGIHTGEVVVGNIGSQSRAKYAVIGDAVNIASRLEAMNKVLKTTVLMSEDTASQVDATGLHVRDLGPQPIRGREGTIRVYTLDAVKKPDEAGADA